MEQFKNADGTYNGVAALAALSGLSEAEVAWTANRIKQLMVGEGKPRAEVLAAVKAEARSKPWATKQIGEA